MATQVNPRGGRVLVRPEAPKETSTGGIIISQKENEKPMSGEIIAVGAKKDVDMSDLKVGTQVMYGKYAGSEVVIDDETLIILNEEDILATVS